MRRILPVFPIRLSVHPSHRADNSKTKKHRKIKIGMDVPMAQVSGTPVFSLKGQRSRSHDIKTSKFCVVFTYRRQHQRIKHGRRRLHTRPIPLLALLCCRCLIPRATRWTATYNVDGDICCFIVVNDILQT